MLYLAMTGAEIAENPAISSPMAWMACHFSPYATGLSNIPTSLPPDSMLILNDRTPMAGHDPALVATQLTEVAESLSCSRILLDLQRQENYDALVYRILSAATCPVGVSEAHAKAHTCPVFLPPLPLTKTVQDYLAPWNGREIWLEAALDTLQISVTPQGSHCSPTPPPEAILPHLDAALHCHYSLELTDSSAIFTLHRTLNDLQVLMENSPCSCYVGLYQELGQNFHLPSCILENP